MSRAALDTKILAYLAGVSRDARDDAKIEQVRNLIGRLSHEVSLVAPTQTLGELFVVLRRGGASAEEARAILLEFPQAFGSSASETRTALAAADLVVDHKLQF
jgi:predicted nucleic acid-binding protein